MSSRRLSAPGHGSSGGSLGSASQFNFTVSSPQSNFGVHSPQTFSSLKGTPNSTSAVNSGSNRRQHKQSSSVNQANVLTTRHSSVPSLQITGVTANITPSLGGNDRINHFARAEKPKSATSETNEEELKKQIGDAFKLVGDLKQDGDLDELLETLNREIESRESLRSRAAEKVEKLSNSIGIINSELGKQDETLNRAKLQKKEISSRVQLLSSELAQSESIRNKNVEQVKELNSKLSDVQSKFESRKSYKSKVIEEVSSAEKSVFDLKKKLENSLNVSKSDAVDTALKMASFMRQGK